MISKQTVKYSLRNLNNSKTRSFFTILSIFIGIATIFIFISFGLGLYNYVGELTSSSSADKVIIQPKGGTLSIFDSNIKFTEDDVEAIEKVTGVYEVSGSYFKSVEVKSQDKSLYTLLASYNPDKPIMLEASNVEIEKGKQLSGNLKEVILGYNYQVDNAIFPRAIRLNQKIEVNGINLKVAGFLSEVGSKQDDAQLYISNDAMEDLFPDENLSYVWIIAKVDLDDIEAVTTRIEKALRKERDLDKGKEDFSVQTFNDLIEGFSSAINIVIGFVLFIALISVFVSAVNTANTMITSVLERTKEIGIIKSIGARNSDILGIFLFESGFLGLLAGIIGVLLGWGLSTYGGYLLDNLGYGFLQPAFPPILFASLIVFATLTGAISGVYPAINASRINPVDALRYE
jgi:putative ABC transport system permease protein